MLVDVMFMWNFFECFCFFGCMYDWWCFCFVVGVVGVEWGILLVVVVWGRGWIVNGSGMDCCDFG